MLNKNLHRRSLNEAQRAMVGAALANLAVGNPSFTNSANLRNCTPPISAAKAAEMVNVSERSVQFAKQVERDAVPQLVEQVK